MRFTEQEARRFIADKHSEAYDKLCSVYRKLDIMPVERPTFTIVDCVYRHCGQYNLQTHDLQYSVPYCVLAGAEYWDTVAHEMVHAFQRSLKFGDCDKAHGNAFLWLLGEMGIDTSNPKKQIYHPYSLVGADLIAEELRKQRGGYTNHVSMQTVRRKSLRELMQEKNQR